MSWESGQGPMASLMPFLSFVGGALDRGSDRSVEIGLASKLRLDGAMDLISSISVGEQAIGFGLDDQRGLIGIAKAELGLNATLNDANRFFLRYEQKPIFRQSGHRLCLWHVQGKGGKLDNGGEIAAARCGFNYWCTK